MRHTKNKLLLNIIQSNSGRFEETKKGFWGGVDENRKTQHDPGGAQGMSTHFIHLKEEE
jgi:hypothetical protein